MQKHAVVRVVAGVDCYLAVDDMLATTDDLFLPAGTVEYFKVPHIGGVSFLTKQLPGTVYVSLMD
jgi:hypothetical protein